MSIPTSRIRTLLIANRGEIACRIIRTARRLGIATVAVYSEADAQALHVTMADRAVGIGAAAATESYLNIQRIVAAAVDSGCDALHPGYGFLSENPALVDACTAAGIVFVGPSADALALMGLKDTAKDRMQAAGVPVVPGYHGEAQDAETLAAEAATIGYPVLIKARAGGGGKGMRLVQAASDFPESLDSARREAAASFGDEQVLIEKYISCPRHVEIQVFGDTQGNVVHLFERDCSLQRRHQKVIEEAPAPGMSAEVREAMTSAAVTAAGSIGYVGAGTIEFIVDGSGPLRSNGFWFMEMNTRLQVEHPVTERVTGIDLVEWQLRVAAGEPLPLTQDAIALDGHAVEARLYAEDVAAGFLPDSGRLQRLAFDTAAALRVDTGVREGDEVTTHYDPMIAKLIAHAPSRERAFRQLAEGLSRSVVLGISTNRAFLATLCRSAVVLDGDMTTHTIGDHLDALVADDPAMRDRQRAVAALHVANGWFRTGIPSSPTPAKSLGAWQLFGEPMRPVDLDGVSMTVSRCGPAHWRVQRDDSVVMLDTGRRAHGRIAVDGRDYRVAILEAGAHVHVQLDGSAARLERPDPARADSLGDGEARVLAPMPGRITAVLVSVGDTVDAGQVLLTLEAMKMEQSLRAATDGVIDAVAVTVGDQVSQGQVLIGLDEPPDPG